MQNNPIQNTLLIGSKYVETLIERLDSARASVYVLMFDWRWYADDPFCDLQRINQAFIRTARRGVKIKILTNYSDIVEILSKYKIEGKKFDSKNLLHSKAVIIDRRFVIMGSHNFSQKAMTSNVETSMLFEDVGHAENLIRYFESLWL